MLIAPIILYNSVWCNGSTRDFGSLSTGSNPVTETTRSDKDIYIHYL